MGIDDMKCKSCGACMFEVVVTEERYLNDEWVDSCISTQYECDNCTNDGIVE